MLAARPWLSESPTRRRTATSPETAGPMHAGERTAVPGLTNDVATPRAARSVQERPRSLETCSVLPLKMLTKLAKRLRVHLLPPN
jgi:hypothetical protein